MQKNRYFYNEDNEIVILTDSYMSKLCDVASSWKDIVSIILVGSLSRGEGSFVTENSTKRITSDIEFIVVTNQEAGNESKNDMKNVFRNIGNDVFGFHTKLLHFDFSFISLQAFIKMGKTLFAYEMMSFGKVIYGVNYLHKLPNITVNNICKLDIYDIALHRLFSIIYYGLTDSSLSDFEKRYIISKNILDILTLDLYQNGILVPGFTNRIDFLSSMNKHIPNDRKELYLICFNTKAGKQDRNYDSIYLLKAFVELLDQLKISRKFNSITSFFRNIRFYTRRYGGIFKRSVLMRHFFVTFRKHFNSMYGLINAYISSQNISLEALKNVIIEHQIMFNFPESEG